MSGELNQISQAIGALQADANAAQRHREAVWQELRTISEKLTVVPQLVADVTAMKPAVEDWKATKQRGLGYLACAGLAGSAITAALGYATGALLKKMGWL